MDMAVLAGVVATAMFAISHFPMLRKAIATRDLHSYSLGNLVLLNVANLVYSLYVFTLPLGPIWILHSFYLAVAATMLVLYVGTGAHRVDRVRMRARRAHGHGTRLVPPSRGAGRPTPEDAQPTGDLMPV